MNEFRYEVKRSGRKSVCVRILEDNTIIISCPKRFSDREIEKFLASKAKWIERHIALNNIRNEFLADQISYEKIFVKGVAVPLTMGENFGSKISDNEVCVKSLKNLKNLYIAHFRKDFMQMMGGVCSQFSLTYKDAVFRDFKSRWGSCNSEHEIKFNWKLLMLPEKFWLYVIVHELCHTVYLDHSKKFYGLMESILPDYEVCKRELKRYSRITTLY